MCPDRFQTWDLRNQLHLNILMSKPTQITTAESLNNLICHMELHLTLLSKGIFLMPLFLEHIKMQQQYYVA